METISFYKFVTYDNIGTLDNSLTKTLKHIIINNSVHEHAMHLHNKVHLFQTPYPIMTWSHLVNHLYCLRPNNHHIQALKVIHNRCIHTDKILQYFVWFKSRNTKVSCCIYATLYLHNEGDSFSLNEDPVSFTPSSFNLNIIQNFSQPHDEVVDS